MSQTNAIPGLDSSKPWSEIDINKFLAGSGGLTTIPGYGSGDGLSQINPNLPTRIQAPIGINSQALSGPLNASDFWRMIIALMIFIIIADSIPGSTGIWWGILSLMGMMAIYESQTNKLISGVSNYLTGQKYIP
jgi:hypothetical protein